MSNPVLKKLQNKYGDYHKDLQKENHDPMSLDHPDNQNDYLDIQCNYPQNGKQNKHKTQNTKTKDEWDSNQHIITQNSSNKITLNVNNKPLIDQSFDEFELKKKKKPTKHYNNKSNTYQNQFDIWLIISSQKTPIIHINLYNSSNISIIPPNNAIIFIPQDFGKGNNLYVCDTETKSKVNKHLRNDDDDIFISIIHDTSEQYNAFFKFIEYLHQKTPSDRDISHQYKTLVHNNISTKNNNRGYNPNIDISNGNNNKNKSVKNNKKIGSKRSRAQLMRQAGQNVSNPAAGRAAAERYNKKRKINNGNVQLRFKKRKDDNYSLYDRLKQELLKQYDGGCPIHMDKYLEFKDSPGSGRLNMFCIECNNALIGRINHNYVFKENKIKIKMKADYMTKDELKLQEQTWNSFDPTWKIAWSKDRCEQVLRDKKSDMNVIECAKMYYKHWKSVEYYEKNVFPPLIRENKENCNEWKIKYNELKKQSSKLKEENKTLCKQLTILKKSNEKYKIKMDKMNEYIEENKKLMDRNKELLDENGMCYGRSDKINTLTFGQINELENKLRNGIVSCNQAKEKKFECNVCLENRANAYITTCKHCAYCIQCEGKLSDDKRICAICNAPYSKLNVMTINNW